MNIRRFTISNILGKRLFKDILSDSTTRPKPFDTTELKLPNIAESEPCNTSKHQLFDTARPKLTSTTVAALPRTNYFEKVDS